MTLSSVCSLMYMQGNVYVYIDAQSNTMKISIQGMNILKSLHILYIIEYGITQEEYITDFIIITGPTV